MVEFSPGLQTRQEERYVILLFLLLLWGGGGGGGVLRVFHDNCPSHSPSNREKSGGMRLFRTVRLIGRIRYPKNLSLHAGSYD